jgi:hypothetical protein
MRYLDVHGDGPLLMVVVDQEHTVTAIRYQSRETVLREIKRIANSFWEAGFYHKETVDNTMKFADRASWRLVASIALYKLL